MFACLSVHVEQLSFHFYFTSIFTKFDIFFFDNVLRKFMVQ